MDWSAAGALLKLAGGAALAVPLAVYLFQDRLIFQPQPPAQERRAFIARHAAAAQSLRVQAHDGTRLHAWHLPASAGAPLVIYFGGNAEDVSWMLAQAMQQAPGVGWLLVDYRGYGASEGAPSEAALAADALRWHDYARDELAPKRIVVFGRSLGSGVAVQLASARPVGSVVLVTPFDSLLEVAKRHYPFLPVSWMLRHRFDSMARAHAVGAPLLCLAAGRDEIIPLVHSKRLYDAWAGPKRWVELPGAGHNSVDGAPGFWEAIRDFLEKNNEKPA